jgi:actin-related protein 6
MGSYLPLSGAQRPEVAANEALCGLVVDCGFSFTHVVPVFDGVVLRKGVRRIDLGGKALTNYLKELVSFRLPPLLPPGNLHERGSWQNCFGRGR